MIDQTTSGHSDGEATPKRGNGRELALHDTRSKKEYIEALPLSLIKPFAKNPRRHSQRQIKQLATSIRAFGFTNPILIDESNEIIAGHGRLQAAVPAGLTEVSAIRISGLSEAGKRALRIADNRIAENSSWNIELLSQELQFLVETDFDIASTGFDAIDADKLLTPKVDATDLDDLPDIKPARHPVSRQGDLWACGDHRLYCGDARDQAALGRLLEGSQVTAVFSDPPYNVPIPGHVGGKGRIQHSNFQMASGEMTRSEFRSFLFMTMTAMLAFCRSGTLIYLCIDWRGLGLLLELGGTLDLRLMNICVWAKSNAGMGSFYRSQHEFIVVFKYGNGAHVNNVQRGRLGRNRSNLWQYAGGSSFSATRQRDLEDHPTVKPVLMVADAIRDATQPGDLVLDLFGGSGSTLLAAQATNRKSALVEIDPAYVDVILRRFQDMTGIEPLLLPERIPFRAIKQARRPQAEIGDE